MEIVSTSGEALSLPELVRLSAVNSEMFAKVWFPKTVRQPAPPMHKALDAALDDPNTRLLNAVIPRDFAKTTKLRLFTAKRIAYSLSRTILYVGASESSASRSIQWIRNAVDRNSYYANTFGLRRGAKWQETEVEIIHGADNDRPIWILGAGITGNIRGINFDDYRPDLIVLDDILTDENALTEEQRKKITDMVLGALKYSLAPQSEEPNAKLVMLNTPQHISDVTAVAEQDELFKTLRFSCWTPETKDLPLEQQESAWPERYSSETLRADKQSAIKLNKLSVFAREKECRLTSPETASFRPDWVRVYDEKPQGLYCVIAIDPVPPPSERQMQKALQGKDYEAITVWGRRGADYFCLDIAENRGHDPNWTISKVFEFGLRYRPVKVVVEAVGYQRVLKGLIEAEMARRRVYWPVMPFDDKRAKFTRIVSTFAGIASQGHMWVSHEHSRFIDQFTLYGPTFTDHDDVLDSSAIAVSSIMNPYLELGTDDFTSRDADIPKIKFRRSAP